jgi:hypothetical protein
MKKGLLFAAAVALAAVSFQALSARTYSTEIDYYDASGNLVGHYEAPCEGPARMTGVATQKYYIWQELCY